MKFICDRKEFKDALGAVVGHTKGVSIPILEHVLIEAKGRTVRLSGHNLDSCSTITMSAEVDKDGACAVPGDRFNKLVGGLPEGSQATITADDKQAHVKAGRAVYHFPIMSADEFPAPLAPKDAVPFTLTAEHVRKILKTPASCITLQESRPYLNGVCLLHGKGELLGVATDGHRLLRSSIEFDAPVFESIIVPDRACEAIVRLAANDDPVAFEVSKTLIGAGVGDRHFVSKLIDGTFPDYARVISPPVQTPMTLDSKDFDAALARLDVARGDRSSIVKLSWRGDVESIALSISTEMGSGQEEIDCDCKSPPKPGEIAAQIDYLRALIDAMGGEHVRLHITDPGSPIRFENPTDDSIVAVCMPCRA